MIRITGGLVVTETSSTVADVLVDGERIVQIAAQIDAPDAKTIDATSMYVLPGGVDAHVHLDSPIQGTRTSDDFESGSRAAAAGGTTSLIDFAVAEGTDDLVVGLAAWVDRVETKSVVDVGFHMVVRKPVPDLPGQLAALADAGVTSIKAYLAYPGELMVDDGVLFNLLESVGRVGSMLCVHAENGVVIDVLVQRAIGRGDTGPGWHGRTRPELMEAEATNRAIAIARLADAPVYMVHLSCADALEEVARARAKGARVFAETCPHYLLLDSSVYDRDDDGVAGFVMTPPLRDRQNHEHLWRGLARGDLQVVSTDHCPTCLVTQKLGRDDFSQIPNGAPGIEHRLVLLHTYGVLRGHLSLERMVGVFATEPARLFGLHPRKGSLTVGADADIVVFDPAKPGVLRAADHHMNVDYSLYEGMPVTGAVRDVLSRGEVVVRDGTAIGRHGRGRYLARGPSGER